MEPGVCLRAAPPALWNLDRQRRVLPSRPCLPPNFLSGTMCEQSRVGRFWSPPPPPLCSHAEFLSPVLMGTSCRSERATSQHLCFPLQYILSGSDDFNLYMWKIPKDPEAGERDIRI